MRTKKLRLLFIAVVILAVIGVYIATIKQKKSLTGSKILPIFVSRKYCIDIDTLEHIYETERLLLSEELDIHRPKI